MNEETSFNRERLAEAETMLRRELADNPNSVATNNNLALVLRQIGRPAEAERLLRYALTLQPDSADIHLNLALLLFDQRLFGACETMVNAALALRANFALAKHLLGLTLQAQGRMDEAGNAFTGAIADDPGFALAHLSLGRWLRIRGRWAEAEAACRRAADLAPDNVDALVVMGDVLFAATRLDEAEASYKRALALAPQSADARGGLGHVALRRADLTEAETQFRSALALRLGAVSPSRGLIEALLRQRRTHEAEAALNRALQNIDGLLASGARAPEALDAFHKCAFALWLLQMGRYEEAWPLHEFRHTESTEAAAWGVKWDGAQKLSIVKWNGESLQGKSILLVAEQGYGDTIQFVRFAPLVKRLGASRVTVVCAPELLALVEGVEGVDAAVDRKAPLDVAEYDRWCGLMSVPAILRMSLAQIPARVPYFALPRRRVDSWSRRLKAALPNEKLKVGLAWAGSSGLGRATDAFIAFGEDRKRSLHVGKLLPLLRMPDIAFVSLQLGEPRTQLGELPSGCRPIDMTPHIRDFADTACIIDKLDLVISVDTSVVHLAGALGKPVWILNRLAGDWRWLLDREDSPWYPSARIFTQKTEGDWDEVIGRVATSLDEFSQSARDEASLS